MTEVMEEKLDIRSMKHSFGYCKMLVPHVNKSGIYPSFQLWSEIHK